ncbi:SDR family NAD(P)-dependent oxidoreductase [Paenibacillus sp. S150]|uniref:SDR family NAD(P)-dependent oxidoreductase n=1 Tax=Paenibacillus sp. S150 TaxID=2749826 RepID=UPI001C58BC78|nr:SDR family NAD(P)-dependent oxidoreductase [Paenibacillus sp. S150]MBW4084437.1 SDR family NAD(P)-dependent oxidoreductase [Paenibacillus sp. S150]
MKVKSEDYIRLERAYHTILGLEQKLEAMEQRPAGEPVAVIGLSCKFPGMVDSPLDYFRMLSEGKHVIEDIPADRWNFDEYNLELKNKIYCRKGGFLQDPYQFDPLYFNISPIEAEFMDPQQRLFLESCWKAFEDAGYTPDKLNQVRCGVYAGVVNNDYYTYLDSIPHKPEPYEVIGNYNSMLSARIAYFLNLKGPAVTLDTACSSSMVAIHMACQAIQNGDSDMALAGGVTLYVTPRPYLLMCESMMLSKSGNSYAFDQRADGFIPGEGCGVVVLKALSKAIADGDQIYGVIRGSGINQDGKSNGITAPNALAQTELQLDVLNRIGLNPERISYVEAHGTGTELGDPIEMEALTNSFSKSTDKKQYCAIGSVKNNMGHLQAAAGVASLIKVLLGMKYSCLFPAINYEKPNRHIDFTQTPFYVNTTLQEWVTPNNQPKIAAINSFGFSGTNAHLIIEEYKQDTADEIGSHKDQLPVCLLPISAQNKETLQTYVRELYDYVQVHQSFKADNNELHEQLRSMVAEHLHIAVEEIDIGTDWDLLGLGIMGLQSLLHELNHKLGVAIAMSELVSLRNIAALAKKVTEVSGGHFASDFPLRLAYTFQTGRQAMKTRQLFIYRLPGELLNQCESFLKGEQNVYSGPLSPEAEACKRTWEFGEQAVHWESMYTGYARMPKRISAPVYPFSKQAYKLGPKPKSAGGSSLTRLSESLSFEHRLPDDVGGKDSHRVKQVEIVPGAYMLQLMIQAANEMLGGNVNYIEQVHFKAPFYRNITDNRVYLELRNQINGQSTHCVVRGVESDQQTYSIGQLRRKPSLAVEYKAVPADPALAVRSFDHVGWYLFVKEQGFDYGESYRTVQKVEIYKDEAVAVIASSMDFDERSAAAFGFDPRMIDGAIQPAIALLQKDFPNQSVLLPNYIESLHIFHPLPRRFTAHLKRTSTLQDAAHSWRCLMDITVLDEKKQVVLEIHQLAVRVVTEIDEHEEVSTLREVFVPLREVSNSDKASDSEELSRTSQLDAIRDYLIQSLSDLLKISAGVIEPEKAFPSYGVDSFLSLKWMSILEKEFGKLPKTILFEHFDIVKLSLFLQAQYPEKFTSTRSEAIVNAVHSTAYVSESGIRAEKRQAVRILEQDLAAHPAEQSCVEVIINRYGMEGLAVARKEMAPELFLGSSRKGFFYLAEREEIILAFLYQGPEEDLEELANELAAFVIPLGKQVVFLLEQRLEKVADRSVGAVEIGTLQRLEALPLNLKGKKYRHLRYAISNFQKLGDCRVEEYYLNSHAGTDQDILDMIDAWCSTKQMVNPYIGKVKNQIIMKSFPSMYRFFLTYLNNKLENVVVITPVPSRKGYLMDLEVYGPDMALGGIEYAIVNIYEQLLKEDAAFLSLGATFGVAGAPEANSDPVWTESLSELWEQGIFNGSGNYQFKNKFRPENRPLLLQRFMDTAPPSLLDVILFIANPVGVSPQVGQYSGDKNLALYDYNTLFVPQDNVAYDLLTDSWSELSWAKELIANNGDLTQYGSYAELIQRLREFFPFPYLIPVSSGREAEAMLFAALPKDKRVILQNMMFPTTVQHQVNNGFVPVEIPKRMPLGMDGNADRGELDIVQLKALLQKGSTAYVAIEMENNAAGGASISIEHLREVRQLCKEYHTPLIIDATRILENALKMSKQELSTTTDWSLTLEVAAEMLKCADYVVASLTKDYGSPVGGIIATLDKKTFQKMTERAALESKKLTDAEQATLFHALADKSKIVEAATKRMQLVGKLENRLKPIWPVVSPIGGHCLIIDTKKIKGLADINYSAQVFLNWMYASTGIRGSIHCGGLNPQSLNHMIRLAVPIGMDEPAIDNIADRLCTAWAQEKLWQPLEAVHEDTGTYGALKNTYRLTSSACPKDTAASTLEGAEKDADHVAIVGLSGQYPEADDLEQFWHNLASGHDAISEIQKDRWELELFYDPDRRQFGKNQCKWGGFLRDADMFDPQFFQITPVEAEKMDPQQRLFLQSAWHAVEDAGYALGDLLDQTDKNIGVFAGATWSEYSYFADHKKGFYPEVNLGSIATRVAYHMGFQGPAMTVDTHCSSSLSAIYLAYESVKNGICKAAIAGGVNLSLHPNKYQFAKFFLSPTGKCHSFGADGDGYVPGEGVGAVLLKPLRDAIADNDHIYGVIRSIRMRHGGKTAGVHVPNPKSQAKLIQETMELAQIHPETVSYVEAHGTGTDLGDPIEVEGLTQAYRMQTNKSQYCALGSVKSNIGHAEAAAGISQLTKVLLQLKHKKLVPSLHSGTLNPNIDFAETPFYVQQELSDWSLTGPGNHPRRAGISSFGAGGVNCHCVIEEYPTDASAMNQLDHEKKRRVFPLSAKTPEALADYVRSLQAYMLQTGNDVSLVNIAFTMQIGREDFKERVVFLAASHEELAELCSRYLQGEKTAYILVGFGGASRKGEAGGAEVGESIERAAVIWSEGGAVDWRLCRGFAPGYRTSLPLYPFAKERYWAPLPDTADEADNNVLSKGIRPEAVVQPETVKGDIVLYRPTNAVLRPLLMPDMHERHERKGRIFVFGSDPEMLFHLRQNGYKPVHIEQGDQFGQSSPERFIINPSSYDDYTSLWNALLEGNRGSAIDVLYLWGIGTGERECETYTGELMHPLLHLCASLNKYALKEPISLLYGYVSEGSKLDVFRSALPAFFRTIHLENHQLRFKVVDMDESTHFYTKVLEELQDECPGAAYIRYHGQQRTVLSYEEIPAREEGQRENEVLRTGGVYLITGGLGGIGYLISQYLASVKQARLVLTGRSPVDSSAADKIARLEQTGASVVYIQADISIKAEVQKVIQATKNTFGAIHGIFHCAGVLRDAYFVHKTTDQFDEVAAAKIPGTVHLDEYTAAESLDIFCLFSSLSAVSGNIGQCDYSYSNSFMDQYAAYRERLREEGRRWGHSISINWPLWIDGGMQIPNTKKELLYEQTGLEVLSTKDGIDAFVQAIQSGYAQVLVTSGDRKRIENTFLASAAQEEGVLSDIKPLLQEEPDEMEKPEELEIFVSGLIKEWIVECTKLPEHKIDIQSHFEEYGLDSIMIEHLISRLEQCFGKVSPTLLFEYQTIEELAQFLADHRTEAVQVHRMRESGISVQESVGPNNKSDTVTATPVLAVASAGQEATAEDDDIAIIGVSGIYPKAENIKEFWHNLEQGVDCVDEVPNERWDWRRYYAQDPAEANHGKIYCKWGGFVDNIDQFDPLLFQISPKEAEAMDPQERLFLQCVWDLFESNGYTREGLARQFPKDKGADVGVYVGVTTNSYQLLGPEQWDKGSSIIPTSLPWSIPNRISYFYNFNGPSLPVDTACSSSLVAIHMACESLRNQDCKMAVAGGVNLYFHPSKYLAMCQLGMLSKTGKCHAFGEQADGFVPGEGIGAVLLKPLKKAEADGDEIWGVIKGTAINHGGRTNGYKVPSPHSQAMLVKKVMEQAQLDPSTINYIEAHGTGTSLGDPIEIEGLTQAYKDFVSENQYCAVGSVKSNIGHSESAAGIASLTKVLLQMKHKRLVPSLHAARLNKHIAFEDTPFRVQTESAAWKPVREDLPLRAAISSFGAGGVNAHMVVESYLSPAEHRVPLKYGVDRLSASEGRSREYAFIYSARNKTRLQESLGQHLEWLCMEREDINLDSLSYTLLCCREEMEERIAFVVSDKNLLIESLRSHLNGWGTPAGCAVFAGNKYDRNRSETSIKDDGRKDRIKKILASRELHQAVALWVSGGSLEWSEWFEEGQQKLRLPTYVPAQDSYWITPKEKQPILCLTTDWSECGKAEEAAASGSLSERHIMLVATREQARHWSMIETSAEASSLTKVYLDNRNSCVSRHEFEVDSTHGSPDFSIVTPLHAIDTIYFLCGMNDESELNDDYAYEQQQNEGALALISLMQVFHDNVTLKVITSKTMQVPGYEKHCINFLTSAIAGITKTIPLEFPMVKVIHIDLQAQDASGVAGELLLAVKEPYNAAYPFLAYRAGKRYRRKLVKAEINKSQIPVLKSHGTYLILGGTGGIGFELSKFLATRYGARLILVGRSPLNEEKQAQLDLLNQIGGGASYLEANLRDTGQTLQRVKAHVENMGGIDGVIHSAADVENSLLTKMTPEIYHRVVGIQASSCMLMKEVHLELGVKNFIFFSSASSFFGSQGGANYSASNCLKDTFANIFAHTYPVNVKLINWGLWGQVGLGKAYDKVLQQKFRSVIPILPKEGLQAFEQIVSANTIQVIAATASDSYIRNETDYYGPRESMASTLLTEETAGPLISASPDTDGSIKTQMLLWLRTIVAGCLKLDSALLHDRVHLGDYGMDSIIGTVILQSLTKWLSNLPSTLMYEYFTIDALADYLLDEHAEELGKIFADVATDPADDVVKLETAALEENSKGKEAAEHDIAIIGIAGVYPQAKELQELWSNLVDSRDCITEVPADRWDADVYEQNGSIYCKWGGFVEQPDLFDPMFFQLSPKEAKGMDPQERMFLQVAAQTFANAGYSKASLDRQKVGVFVGVTNNTYQLLGVDQWDHTSNEDIPNSQIWSIPNRVSFHYNLAGPSMPVDTACSSSLTALHLACESIQSGESGMALVGGVNLYLHPYKYSGLSQMKMLSPTGQCRAFNDEANGFVPGEGIGAVLVKPLKQALQDGDFIHGIVKSTAVNHGGRTNGYTVPNPNAQASLIEEALLKGNIDPRTITYVEAHGTGTVLGDPIEIAGLTSAFRKYTSDKQFCAIASVKTNIGHLEAASGIIGLTKILLQMKHQTLVPTLHHEPGNTRIRFADSPFYLQKKVEAWNRPTVHVDGEEVMYPRRAAVSSFGAGGANAHAIIEEYLPKEQTDHHGRNRRSIIPLSARSPRQLQDYVKNLLSDLKGKIASGEPAILLERVAYTLQIGRDPMEERLAVIASSMEELLEKLDHVASGTEKSGIFIGRAQSFPAYDSDSLIISLEDANIEATARAWVNGGSIRWESFYTAPLPIKLPLPACPFSLKSYWLNPVVDKSERVEKDHSSVAALHPLVQRKQIEGQGIHYSGTFMGKERFISEHRVEEYSVFPGAAFLEMAFEAASFSMEKEMIAIRNVTFMQPLIFRKEPIEVELAIQHSTGRNAFEIYSASGSEEKLKHVQGEIVYRSTADIPEAHRAINLQGMIDHSASFDKEQIYRYYRKLGIDYGPVFQNVSKLYVRNRSILGELAPHQEVQDTLGQYELHPILLDGALQCMIAYGMLDQEKGLELPFYVRELHVIRKDRQWKYVYIAPSGSGEHAYDVTILDEMGESLVCLLDFTVSPLRSKVHEVQRRLSSKPLPEKESYGNSQATWDSGQGQAVTDHIKNNIAFILEWSVEEIDEDTELGDYGFDSLSFTRLADQLNDDFQITVSPALFFQYTTVRKLAEHLVESCALSRNETLTQLVEDRAAPQQMEPQHELDGSVSPAGTSSSDHSGEDNFPVAIVGMAGRMPQSATLEQFWEHLKAGNDLVTEVPKKRWDWREYYGDPIQEKNKTKAKWGGFLDDIDKFDARFFKIAAREAELMDPQQRGVLELAWQTVEHAGYSMNALSGSKTGVFVGVAANTDYNDLVNKDAEETEAYQSTGVAISVLVNRLSYMFNWHGPSEPIDTACSSSLVALHRAVDSLRSGECEMALAGGVQLILSPRGAISFSKSGMLSPDGRCKTFDQSANGYVRSEGMGLVLLKPLKDAERSGDQIYGVIRGTAVNHGGKGNSLTSPNPNAQAEVIMKAVEKAGIDIGSISYIETHGTGTQLGDPVEINGLKKAFETMALAQGETSLPARSCGLGSVKTNVGHMETAAGMASLFKVLLSLKHRELPPNVHYRKCNPQIHLEDSPFYIVDRLQKWGGTSIDGGAQNIPLRAGISSFGFGGANAHLILEEYINDAEPAQPASDDSDKQQLIILSAKDSERLRDRANQLADYLESSLSVSIDGVSCEMIEQELLKQMGEVLSISEEEIDHSGNVLDMGFDQMGLYQLMVKVEQHYGVKLQLEQILQLQTPDRLIHHLCKVIGSGSTAEFSEQVHLASVAYTLQLGRDAMEERACWIVSNSRQLIEQLRSYCSNQVTLYAGRVTKKGNGPIDELKSDVRQALAIQDYSRLAELWTQGAKIDWQLLYEGKKVVPRIALPGYPFQRTAYWFQPAPISHSNCIAGNDSGLLVEPSDRENFAYRVRLDEFHASFEDHVIGDRVILPGAMYFEIVQKTVQQTGRNDGFELTQLFWLTPYIHNGDSLGNDLYIRWTEEDSGQFKIKICSFDESGQREHFQVSIRETSRGQGSLGQPIHLIQERCGESNDITELYGLLKTNGLCYGSTYQTVVNLRHGNKEAIAELLLHDQLTEAWQCSPSMIDGAFQSVAVAGSWDNVSGTYLPFSVKRVSFYERVPSSCYAYIREKGKSGSLMLFDLYFVHHEGRIIAEFEDFGLKLYTGPDNGMSFLVQEWLPCPIEKANDEAEKPIFIVGSSGKLNGSLLGMKEACWLQTDMTNRNELEHLLVQMIPANTQSISMVIHLEQEQEAESGYPIYEGMQNLIQILVKRFYKLPVRFLCLYGTGDEYIAHRALVGFGRTAALENDHFVFRFLEYDELNQVPLQAELYAEPVTGCLEIKYDRNRRLIRQLREVDNSNEQAAAQPKISHNGTYVVTGGNGGLGLLFAAYLLSKYHANVAIVSRSAISSESMIRLEEAARFGGSIRHYKADVSRVKEVESCMSQVKSDYGSIHGVFHFAGALNDSLLFRKTMSDAEKVLAPKIHGIHNLDRSTRGEKLELFVVFSSITAIAGNKGQADYAYANRYMDEYIRMRNRRDFSEGRICRSYTINWPLWEHGGMQVNDSVKERLQADNGLEILQERDGWHALEKILANGWEQALPVRGDKERINQSLEALQLLRHVAVKSETTYRKDYGDHPSNPQQAVEDALLADLQRMFSEILKIDADELDPEEDLEMYGFDSIMMVEVLSRIESAYRINMEPGAINEHKSLKVLSGYLSMIIDGAQLQATVKSSSQSKPEQKDTVQSVSTTTGMEGRIAVIGMTCCFPQSSSLEQYWTNILLEKDMITEVPKERWDVDHYYNPDRKRKDTTYSKWGGFLQDIEKFDAGYWGIPDEVALVMDPQHRLLLELVEELWSRAGYRPEEVRGKDVGVFIGGAESSYVKSNLGKVPPESMKHIVVNTISNMMAARISDTYDLRGPSLTMDTACSSSLVSIHEACSQILNGTCDMAIAGGVQVLLDPIDHIGMSQAGVLSPDKRAYVFDERAQGIVIGEGAGVVLLKPMKQAVEDGDFIHAVIMGSAVNNDGHTMGLTTPNIEGQKNVIQQALRKSGVSPDTISYYEAHGTGTLLGDPIEIRAATQSYREFTEKKQYCGVGSVKANMGHLLRAAGIGSFIKAGLAVQHSILPKTIHCDKPHPRFQFEASPFYPVTKSMPWEGIEGKRRAAISSFGFGGTNCHMIIENFEGEQFPEYSLQRQPLQLPEFHKKVYWLGSHAGEETETFYLRILAQLQSGEITPEQALQMESLALKGESV